MGRICTFIPLLLKIFCNIKIVFCEHSSVYEYTFFKEKFKSKITRKIFNYLINTQADKIVFLTNNELKIYNKNKNKTMTIYNFIDDQLLCKSCRYNLRSKRIITVGRIEYGKGIDILIEVAKIVFSKYNDWQWDIYGTGEQEYISKINTLIELYGLKDNVHLKGECRNIYNKYSNYSMFVFTSRFEALPTVLLEAKAKRLPIVSFNINSGPSEIVIKNVNGYLVKPFDYNKMAQKICGLIEKPELRLYFSNNAYENIDKFTKATVIKKWRDLIDEIL